MYYFFDYIKQEFSSLNIATRLEKEQQQQISRRKANEKATATATFCIEKLFCSKYLTSIFISPFHQPLLSNYDFATS